MNFKVVDSKIVFKGKVFDVQVDTVRYNATGNLSQRDVALHKGGAVIVALTEKRNIIFVKQFRYPLQKEIIELPAGKLDEKEEPRICAARELKEETGYSAGKIDYLGSIYTTPGYSNEELHIFLAEDLVKGEHSREEGEEGMQILELPLEKAVSMISEGKIKDAKTIAGIFFFLSRENKIEDESQK